MPRLISSGERKSPAVVAVMSRERKNKASSPMWGRGEGNGKEEEEEEKILEINLISAQGLKTPSGNFRRMYTYAIAWVDPNTKLRTRVDRVGGENPTWNDKFLFRVDPDFLARETAAVVVEIFAAGYIRDYLLGAVRFLLGSCVKKSVVGTPSFTAVQIRRPSGRFHGVLNIAAAVSSSKTVNLEIFRGSSAISFGDLAGQREVKGTENRRPPRRLSRIGSRESDVSSAESLDFDLSSLELSDGNESTCTNTSVSSASPPPLPPPQPNALKEWNGMTSSMAGALKELNSVDGGGRRLCGLMLQRRVIQ